MIYQGLSTPGISPSNGEISMTNWSVGGFTQILLSAFDRNALTGTPSGGPFLLNLLSNHGIQLEVQ